MTADVQLILFLAVCIFMTVVSLVLKVYGTKILFSVLTGIFWIFFAFQIDTDMIKILFAFFGAVFIIIGVMHANSYMKGRGGW